MAFGEEKPSRPRSSWREWWKNRKDWQRVLIGFQLLNVITFTVVRICLLTNGGLAAALESHVNDENYQEMVYLIAGNLNQPEPAFEFMMSEVEPNWTYVNFETQGWSARQTAKVIIDDIQENDYKARVFAISVGDRVARYLEEGLGEEIEIYNINPCSSRKALKPEWRALTSLALPVEAICHLGLGWLSVIPFIGVEDGKSYSLITLIDQYWIMAYDRPPLETTETSGTLLSTEDEFLRNDYLKELFDNGRIIEIETSHADTTGSAEKYLEGIRRLLEP